MTKTPPPTAILTSNVAWAGGAAVAIRADRQLKPARSASHRALIVEGAGLVSTHWVNSRMARSPAGDHPSPCSSVLMISRAR